MRMIDSFFKAGMILLPDPNISFSFPISHTMPLYLMFTLLNPQYHKIATTLHLPLADYRGYGRQPEQWF